MTEPLRIRVTRRAEVQIRRASEWWVANRPSAPDLLLDELESALSLIVTQPFIGSRSTNSKLSGVRRVLLRRTRYHVYYRVLTETRTAEVLAVWHTSREKDPPL